MITHHCKLWSIKLKEFKLCSYDRWKKMSSPARKKYMRALRKHGFILHGETPPPEIH